ncbi:unnamed protein product, partial [marine sediment metagenome]
RNHQVFVTGIEAGETIKAGTGLGAIMKEGNAYIYQITPG